jgi:hypothetical protein
MPVKVKPVKMEESEIEEIIPEKKEKKKRVINPETMTYIKALSIYK